MPCDTQSADKVKSGGKYAVAILAICLACLAGCAAFSGADGWKTPIPFEFFASFERVEQGNPAFALKPPEWAAAAHAIVVDNTVHYLWARRLVGNRWEMMHSTAPARDPAEISHDPENPVLTPTEDGFDNRSTEYPFPFFNPADGKYYVYYLGRGKRTTKQTGLLVATGSDFSQLKRVTSEPVIPATAEHEQRSSSHPSAVVVGDTIHIIYTGKYRDGKVTICHATAPTSNPAAVTKDPAAVTKDPANPVFAGSGEAWDSKGVREGELLKGPDYFHITYGGTDGETWRIGHVRTKDWRTFETNPHNPVFTTASDPEAFDSDGILTPQIFQTNGSWYMIYAGKKGKEWQSGLARARDR